MLYRRMVHSTPSLLPSLMLSACQYTDMQTLFKPFGTKPSIPSRNLSFSLCRCWTGMI